MIRSSGSIFRHFLLLGLTSFGGPVAHIGYLRNAFVSRNKWLSDTEFSNYLALCQFLPGPASSQLGMSIGYHVGGLKGLFAAFLGFTLPSFVLMWLAGVLIGHIDLSVYSGAISGLKLVAVAVVIQALVGMFNSLCPDDLRKWIAIIAAMVMMVAGEVWLQILVIFLAFVFGYLMGKAPVKSTDLAMPKKMQKYISMGSLAILFLLFIGLPLLTLFIDHKLLTIAHIMVQAGSLVFGGGHVVLPLLEEGVVGAGILSQDIFLAGYGLAQAMPGPLFTFGSFVGAASIPNQFGFTAALLACMMIFLPGMLLLLACLPIWSSMSRNRGMQSALMMVNAAVVGLLFSAFYDPVLVASVTSPAHAAMALAAIASLVLLKLPPWLVVLLGGFAGQVIWGGVH